MAQSNSKPPLAQNSGLIGSLHSNSSSSLLSYGNNHRLLPPLSPMAIIKDSSMEDIDVSTKASFLVLGSSSISSSFSLENKLKGSSTTFLHSLIPPRKEYDRLTNCDGIDQERKCEGEVIDDGLLFTTYMNLDSNSTDHRYNNVDSTTTNSNKRPVSSSSSDHGGDFGPTSSSAHQFRSLSFDSAYKNSKIGNEFIGKSLPNHSENQESDKFSFGFGINGEFSEYELKRIKNDEKLAEVALLDPKRAKRILANRHSAARSKERKTRYIAELEHKVQTLHTNATTLSNELTIIQKEINELTNHNNELKFRLKAMEQHARLRDDLHKALAEEVKHLKLAANEHSKGGEDSVQHMLFKHQM